MHPLTSVCTCSRPTDFSSRSQLLCVELQAKSIAQPDPFYLPPLTISGSIPDFRTALIIRFSHSLTDLDYLINFCLV